MVVDLCAFVVCCGVCQVWTGTTYALSAAMVHEGKRQQQKAIRESDDDVCDNEQKKKSAEIRTEESEAAPTGPATTLIEPLPKSDVSTVEVGVLVSISLCNYLYFFMQIARYDGFLSNCFGLGSYVVAAVYQETMGELRDMALRTAEGVYAGGWKEFGYWFATPEAWEQTGNYRYFYLLLLLPLPRATAERLCLNIPFVEEKRKWIIMIIRSETMLQCS
jgi:hypothetical protein